MLLYSKQIYLFFKLIVSGSQNTLYTGGLSKWKLHKMGCWTPLIIDPLITSQFKWILFMVL